MRLIGLAVVLAVGLFPAPLAALKEMGRVVTPWVSAGADRGSHSLAVAGQHSHLMR
jgi:hypothetical protein